MNGDFVRELVIEPLKTTLRLRQYIEGKVSCVVWDASLVLAKFLEKRSIEKPDFLRNVHVLELGAGVGCVGITAACLGANVHLSDLPEALPLLASNVEMNREQMNGSAEVISLIWGEDVDIKIDPDMIVLADCVYYEEVVDSLVKTLNRLSTKKTEIFLSQEMRESEKQKSCWMYFLDCIQQYFNVHTIPIREQHADFSCPEILLLRLTKL